LDLLILRVSKSTALNENKQKKNFKDPIVNVYNIRRLNCGVEAKNVARRGALLENLNEMSQLTSSNYFYYYRRSGSGGALALARGESSMMMEHTM